VEEDALVLGVGDRLAGLQPPHRLPHVLGLQGGRVSPLITHVQGWKEGGGGAESHYSRAWTSTQCIMGFCFGGHIERTLTVKS